MGQHSLPVTPSALDRHAWHPAPPAPRPWLAALLAAFYAPLGYLYVGRVRMAVVVALGLELLRLLALWAASHWPWDVSSTIGLAIALGPRIAVATHASRLARDEATHPRLHGGRLALALVGFYAVVIAVEMASRLFTNAYVAQPFRIPSGSMEPALLAGDFVYVVPDHERAIGEDRVVAFRYPGPVPGAVYVKRVAAVSGDTVEMRAGQLYRGGKPVAEPWAHHDGPPAGDESSFAWQREYLVGPVRASGYHPTADDWGPLRVPPNGIFVLGDDRHHSEDSRFFGFVAAADVVGHPTVVYYSVNGDVLHPRWDRVGTEVR